MILGVGRRYMMYVSSALISDLTSTIGRLSAYLFEITQNQTYRNAASLSQSFIESNFHNPDTGTIRDAITLSNCRYTRLAVAIDTIIRDITERDGLDTIWSGLCDSGR